MIIAQILLRNATEYERKCQRVDYAGLSADHQVSVSDEAVEVTAADVAHVYGQLRRRWFRPLGVPYVESRQADLPEAVEETYFANSIAGRDAGVPRIASLRRHGIISLVEQTMHRLHRTRDDIECPLSVLRAPLPVPLGQRTTDNGEDANELSHAILTALFRPEVAQQKIDASRQTIAKFRPRQRTRVLTALYESLRR